jgi:hypothetical protein
MYICSIWFDLDVNNLLREKLITELCTSSIRRKSIFVDASSEFVSLCLSFSISTDWSMLYYALVSIFPYLSKSDTITCRRYNSNFSVLVNIALDSYKLSNRQFYMLFYMCTLTYDAETDMDCVYQFWTHGRKAFVTNTNALRFRRRNIAFDSIYSAYFFSKFDANLWYNISVEIATRQTDSYIALLLGSLYYISFVNTNLNHSLLSLHG